MFRTASRRSHRTKDFLFMVLGIIFVTIFLSILVLVHELGHFLAAKKFGLLVEEFGFGLPPRVWGKKIGETIYSINALPFGGFVKILGEDSDVPEQNEISIVESEKISVSDEQIEVAEEIAVSVNSGRSFRSISIIKRAAVLFSGVFMNFLFGWLVLAIVFSIGSPQAIAITQIFPNSPASQIGLQSGDRILNISADDFIKFTNENRGKEITLKIDRNGQMKEFTVVSRLNPPQGEGALGIGLIETGFAKQNIFSSIWEALKTSVQIIGLIFSVIFGLLSQLFTTGTANLAGIAGPVGIVKATSQAQSLGFSYLLQLLALISLNLVVINIFPFPALDGGRLLFLIIEKIKGSPLPVKFERYANSIGMILLLTLMAAITIRDIVKF